MSESEQEKSPEQPIVPKAERVVDLIRTNLDVIASARENISNLRPQLRWSNQYYGTDIADPSVKPRAKKEV